MNDYQRSCNIDRALNWALNQVKKNDNIKTTVLVEKALAIYQVRTLPRHLWSIDWDTHRFPSRFGWIRRYHMKKDIRKYIKAHEEWKQKQSFSQ